MSASDQQLDDVRRRLPAIVAQFHGRCLMAAELLERKARLCPNSAEALAWRTLNAACADFQLWLNQTGMVDEAIQQTGVVGARSNLAAGGEARAGQTADAVPG